MQVHIQKHMRHPDDISWNCYEEYGFRQQDLPLVVELLDPPNEFRTPNGTFTGEEGVLLLLLVMKLEPIAALAVNEVCLFHGVPI